MAAPRRAFRLLQHPLRNSVLRSPLTRRTNLFQRRAQSTAATESSGESQSAFQKLWQSEVGPKTIHFWAPIMKWGMVLAGIADLTRPAETLSVSQNTALMITGLIWTRWCFVIRPQNYFLASVNFAVFLIGSTQVTRIINHKAQHSDKPLTQELKEKAEEVKDDAVAKVKG